MSKFSFSNGVCLNIEHIGLLSVAEERLEIKREPISNIYIVEHTPFARGKFAAVRKCTHRETGVEYAAKFIRKRRRAMDQRADILHEVAVLAAAAESARIVALHEVFETASEMALVLELAAGGELQRVLDVQEGLEEVQVARLMKQILEGLRFLHSHNIAHLDLKPQNLLLTGEYPDCDVKLCDFGISRVIQKGVEVREILGTPDYVAPEVLSYEPISLATDIWSVGVLAYVLVSGFSPFGGDSKQETFCNISQGKLEFPDDLFENVSNTAKEFIHNALKIDPRKRPTIQDCLSHPWLVNVCAGPTTVSICQDTLITEDNKALQKGKINGEITPILPLEKGVNETKENIDGNCNFSPVKVLRDTWTEKTCKFSSPDTISGKGDIVLCPLKQSDENNHSSVSNGNVNEYDSHINNQYIINTNGIHDSASVTSASDNEDDKDSPVNKRPKNCLAGRRSSFPVASCVSRTQYGTPCCPSPPSHTVDLHLTPRHHKSITGSPVSITVDRGIIC